MFKFDSADYFLRSHTVKYMNKYANRTKEQFLPRSCLAWNHHSHPISQWALTNQITPPLFQKHIKRLPTPINICIWIQHFHLSHPGLPCLEELVRIFFFLLRSLWARRQTVSFAVKKSFFRASHSKYRLPSLLDYCGMDSSALQGLSFISMASNNSLLPRAIFSPVPCSSMWGGSVVYEGECVPQQILHSTEHQLNQSGSADTR